MKPIYVLIVATILAVIAYVLPWIHAVVMVRESEELVYVWTAVILSVAYAGGMYVWSMNIFMTFWTKQEEMMKQWSLKHDVERMQRKIERLERAA